MVNKPITSLSPFTFSKIVLSRNDLRSKDGKSPKRCKESVCLIVDCTTLMIFEMETPVSFSFIDKWFTDLLVLYEWFKKICTLNIKPADLNQSLRQNTFTDFGQKHSRVPMLTVPSSFWGETPWRNPLCKFLSSCYGSFMSWYSRLVGGGQKFLIAVVRLSFEWLRVLIWKLWKQRNW